jgi:hypothetical protein
VLPRHETLPTILLNSLKENVLRVICLRWDVNVARLFVRKKLSVEHGSQQEDGQEE